MRFENSTDGNAALKWEHFNKFDSDSPFKEVNKSNLVEWAKSVNEILLRFERTPGPSSESEGDRPGSVEPVAGIQKEKNSRKRKSGEVSNSNLSSIEPIHCAKKLKMGKTLKVKQKTLGTKANFKKAVSEAELVRNNEKNCISHTTFSDDRILTYYFSFPAFLIV